MIIIAGTIDFDSTENRDRAVEIGRAPPTNHSRHETRKATMSYLAEPCYA
jgi:hypothetical protein